MYVCVGLNCLKNRRLSLVSGVPPLRFLGLRPCCTDRCGVELDRSEYEMVRLPATQAARVHDLADHRPRLVQTTDVRLAVA